MSDSSSERWEVGSLFDLPRWQTGEPGTRPWTGHSHHLTGTGRGALAIAIDIGGYRRLWVPTYYCQEVVSAIAATGVEIALYPDDPRRASPEVPAEATRDGDAIVLVNYFGLRGAPSIAAGSADILEDHTHDPCSPWALNSGAAYCFASLRKLYPLADGGVLWSPRARPIGPKPPLLDSLALASATKLGAMILKRLYLEGHPISKDQFRALLEGAEGSLYASGVSSITPTSAALLASFPIDDWRDRRRKNFDAFASSLGGARRSDFVLHRPYSDSALPFSALLEFETPEVRDHFHQKLCGERVYASTLWPLEGSAVPSEHVELSKRLLSIPIDMRYERSDLARAARVVAETS